IGCKIVGEKRFYQVHWQGYDNPNDYTWEPEENFIVNQDDLPPHALLAEYLQSITEPLATPLALAIEKADVSERSKPEQTEKRKKAIHENGKIDTKDEQAIK